jgi:hypothetical protein
VGADEDEEEAEDEEVMWREGRDETGKASVGEVDESAVELDEEVALEPIVALSLQISAGVLPPSEGSVVMARTQRGSSGSLEVSPYHKTGKLMECDQ